MRERGGERDRGREIGRERKKSANIEIFFDINLLKNSRNNFGFKSSSFSEARDIKIDR